MGDLHRNDHREAAARPEHGSAMNHKRRPGTRQLREPNALLGSTCEGAFTSLACESLIPNERRIADDRLNAGQVLGVQAEEVGQEEVSCANAIFVRESLGDARMSIRVNLDA